MRRLATRVCGDKPGVCYTATWVCGDDCGGWAARVFGDDCRGWLQGCMEMIPGMGYTGGWAEWVCGDDCGRWLQGCVEINVTGV